MFKYEVVALIPCVYSACFLDPALPVSAQVAIPMIWPGVPCRRFPLYSPIFCLMRDIMLFVFLPYPSVLFSMYCFHINTLNRMFASFLLFPFFLGVLLSFTLVGFFSRRVG